MHSRLVPLLMVLLSFLLSCQGQSGSSDGPSYSVAGRWNGAMASDDGEGNNRPFFVVFEVGEPLEEGAVLGRHLACQVLDGLFCERSSNPRQTENPFTPNNCPGKPVFQWRGELVGADMTAITRNSSNETIELEIEFVDENTAVGTYEYVAAGTVGTARECLGETGTITLERFLSDE